MRASLPLLLYLSPLFHLIHASPGPNPEPIAAGPRAEQLLAAQKEALATTDGSEEPVKKRSTAGWTWQEGDDDERYNKNPYVNDAMFEVPTDLTTEPIVEEQRLAKRAPEEIFVAPANAHGQKRSRHQHVGRQVMARVRRSQKALHERAWTDGYFYGASSYYLFALNDNDRHAVLNALSSGGFKVVRIFVASVLPNNKGSGNAAVNDLEHEGLGIYDDTILAKIDQLMYDCSVRGLKLLIALSDRYSLGFWSTDQYALSLKIVAPGTSGVQKVANAATYYTSSSAAGTVQARITHILKHKNPLLGDKPWAELDNVIYGLEAQNEPQGHMDMASPTWACERSAHIKSLLPGNSSILVSSGGGITTTTSLGDWAMKCDAIDIISVHDYGTNGPATVSALVAAKKATNKIVMLGEWGAKGVNKPAIIAQFVAALKAAQIPWMYWEVVKPGQAASDFEVWTDEAAWAVLTGGEYDGASASYPTVGTYDPNKPTYSRPPRTTTTSTKKAAVAPTADNKPDDKPDATKADDKPAPTTKETAEEPVTTKAKTTTTTPVATRPPRTTTQAAQEERPEASEAARRPERKTTSDAVVDKATAAAAEATKPAATPAKAASR